MFVAILHSFVVVVDDVDVVVVHGSGGPLDTLENPMRVAMAVVLGEFVIDAAVTTILHLSGT